MLRPPDLYENQTKARGFQPPLPKTRAELQRYTSNGGKREDAQVGHLVDYRAKLNQGKFLFWPVSQQVIPCLPGQKLPVTCLPQSLVFFSESLARDVIFESSSSNFACLQHKCTRRTLWKSKHCMRDHVNVASLCDSPTVGIKHCLGKPLRKASPVHET